MISMKYYDRKGRPVSEELGRQLFSDANNDGRKVALTELSASDGAVFLISTVHLVLDHSFGGGVPIIFETMVFGPEGKEEGAWTSRYTNEAEALVGHKEIVRGVSMQHGGSTLLRDEVNPSPPDELIIEEFL
jgi:hypothetical protein